MSANRQHWNFWITIAKRQKVLETLKDFIMSVRLTKFPTVTPK